MNSYTGLGYQPVYLYLKNTTILEGQQPFLQKLIIKILGKQYDNLLQNMCTSTFVGSVLDVTFSGRTSTSSTP